MEKAESQKPKQQSKQIKEDQKNYALSYTPQGKKVFVFHGYEMYPFVLDPEYDLDAIKGFGTYSMVCSGRNNITGQLVAIKRIHNLFDELGELGDTKRILREIKILKFLKHRNIVGLKDMLKIDNPLNYKEVYLCMEYMQYTLKRLILSPQTAISDDMIQYLLYQLINGIYFMHSADIIHRDLKPQNILINKNLELKIADMNLARKEIATDENTFYVTSRPYRAPQIFINPNTYSKAIDIWSIGCIFAELLGKTVIFLGKDFVDQLRRFVAILGKPTLDIFPDLDPKTAQGLARVFRDIPDREKVDWKFLFPKASQKALDLLDHMLVYDPKLRYTAEECLNHPYLEVHRKRPRPKCQQVFDFSFDKIEMTLSKLRGAIYEQVQSFQEKKTHSPGPISEVDKLEKKVKVE